MANKRVWPGILATALVFVFTVIGCDDGSTADTWTDVTSLSQVNGSWKAPSTATITQQGMTITANYSNYIITFNAAAKTLSASGTITQTYSGGNINELWSSLKANLEYMNQQNGITVTNINDANHSVTMTYNNFSQPFPDDDLTEASLQINQSGTKLKMSQGGAEIIYTKQ